MGQRGLSRAGLVHSIDTVLGSRPMSGSFRSLTKGRLRVLGYHGISDPTVFEGQMRHLVNHFEPVGPELVIDALEGPSLPERSVWVTFDDADPTVIDNALPILRRMGVPATLFVCPGVVGTDLAYWWQIVEDYETDPDVESIGATPDVGWLAFLKTTADSRRREVVAEMTESLTRLNGFGPTRRQVTVDELRQFGAYGTIGNHTWDHPCLDMCSDEEQTRQIAQAHNWFGDTLGIEPTLFAYPNGNHAHHAEGTLRDLGYRLALLFDHHLAHSGQNPLRLSRIRTSDKASPARYAALLSGVHSALHSGRSLFS